MCRAKLSRYGRRIPRQNRGLREQMMNPNELDNPGRCMSEHPICSTLAEGMKWIVGLNRVLP